jgi:BirA family transcriptional regulator, biotin operon repressor / biotin---[acetyl-CoA-carboxylase] ligase
VSGGRLGAPRLHLRATDSTNARARELAAGGAVHGTLVTAGEQSAGRGRQGRTWSAPPGQALLMSLVLREWPALLPLAVAVGVADVAGEQARIKWPNDVLLEGRKVAGILVEARPQEGWAVAGVGLNVAVDLGALPPELHATAGTLGRSSAEMESTLRQLLGQIDRWLATPEPELLAAYRARDALAGHTVWWSDGAGRAAGVDARGRLIVDTAAGRIALDAGEVHLGGYRY